jgi:hypothetical protein
MIRFQFSKLVVAGCALAAVTGAFAQSMLQQAAGYIASPNIAQELKLTVAQIAKRTQLLSDYDKKRSEIGSQLEKAPARSEYFQGELDKILLDVQNKLLGILTPPQTTRLKQLAIQQVGIYALSDPGVADDLGLTAAQKAKIASIRDSISKPEVEYQESLAQALASLPDPGTDPAAIRAYEEKQKGIVRSMKPKEAVYIAAKIKGEKDLLATLTPVQQKLWKGMKGKQFKFG